MAILAIDIGGSTIKYGVWNNEELNNKGSFKTPQTWEEMKEEFSILKQSVERDYKIEGVAISSPGAVNQKKGIIEGFSALPYIHHFPIQREWEELFGCNVSMENDANCAALAEIWKGAGEGLKDILFVVIGTGIGGSVIVDGKIRHGKNLFGGEFGYMLLTEDETFSNLGTPVQMAKRVCERKGIEESSLSGEEIFKLATEGDGIAREEVEKFYYYVAKGIFNLQYSFDPERIVIGGGVSNKAELIPSINEQLAFICKKVEGASITPEIITCHFKNDANLIGAVYNYLNN